MKTDTTVFHVGDGASIEFGGEVYAGTIIDVADDRNSVAMRLRPEDGCAAKVLRMTRRADKRFRAVGSDDRMPALCHADLPAEYRLGVLAALFPIGDALIAELECEFVDAEAARTAANQRMSNIIAQIREHGRRRRAMQAAVETIKQRAGI